MSAEPLQAVVARVEAAIVMGVTAPGLEARVAVSDLRRILTELERSGALAPRSGHR